MDAEAVSSSIYDDPLKMDSNNNENIKDNVNNEYEAIDQTGPEDDQQQQQQHQQQHDDDDDDNDVESNRDQESPRNDEDYQPDLQRQPPADNVYNDDDQNQNYSDDDENNEESNDSSRVEQSYDINNRDDLPDNHQYDDNDDDDDQAADFVDYNVGGSQDAAAAHEQSYDEEGVQQTYDGESNEQTGQFSWASNETNEAINNDAQLQAVAASVPESSTSPVRVDRSTSTPAASERSNSTSGKFVLRSSRQADALHFINTIRQAASTDNGAEKEELITVLRSTVKNAEEKKLADRDSLVKSVYVQAYETNVISGMTSPTSPPAVTPAGPIAKPRPAPVKTETSTQPVSSFAAAEPQREEIENRSPAPAEIQSTEVNVAETRTETDTQTPAPEVSAFSSPAAEDETSKLPSKDQPVWLNAALNKQKRSAEIIEALEKPSSSSVTGEQGTAPPPWVKDRITKRSITIPTSAVNGESAAQSAAATPADETIANVPESKPEPSPTPTTPGAPTTPQWKLDIESRKKLKNYVVAQKPEQPIRLGTVPDWKRQLSEKAKMKREQSIEGLENGTSGSSSDVVDSPWKKELANLKRLSASTPEEDAQPVPEWLRIAEEKQKAGATGNVGTNSK